MGGDASIDGKDPTDTVIPNGDGVTNECKPGI